jgi:hypothetical protein
MEGTDEVMEVVLTHPVDPDSLLERLSHHTPPGLVVVSAEVVSASDKARVRRVVYQIPVPPERRPAVRKAVIRLRAQTEYVVTRAGGKKPVDLTANLLELALVGGVLRICQRVTAGASAGPRDVLAALNATDLEGHGSYLTRTNVELPR